MRSSGTVRMQSLSDMGCEFYFHARVRGSDFWAEYARAGRRCYHSLTTREFRAHVALQTPRL